MLRRVNVQTSSARSIIVHSLSSRASRALRIALRRLPPRVQKFGLRAMNPVVRRWPTVAVLLGFVPESVPPSSQAVQRNDYQPKMSRGVERVKSAPDAGVWIAALESSPEITVRVKAVRALAETKLPSATTALCVALRDPSAEVAAEAADALRHHRGTEAIDALSRVVENADGYFSGGVRAAAIRTLSAILPRGKGEPILAAVADADAEVSVAAIAGVVDRDEPGGGEALFSVLENPRGYYVSLTRSAAARGMRRLVTQPDVARLRALLEAEHDGEVREVLNGLIDGGTSGKSSMR